MDNQANTAAAEAFQGNKEKLSRDIGGMVNEAAELIKDYGGKRFESAKATLSQAQTMVTDTAKEYADVTDEYVRTNPWKALGIAAAAGLLVGMLIARR